MHMYGKMRLAGNKEIFLMSRSLSHSFLAESKTIECARVLLEEMPMKRNREGLRKAWRIVRPRGKPDCE